MRYFFSFQDVDECIEGTDECVTFANCTNTDGSYNCKCKAGFTGDGFDSCQDIDECTDSNHDCDENAKCINTVGDYTCACNAGYEGNGRTCKGIRNEFPTDLSIQVL